VVSVLAHEASDMKAINLNPRCDYFFSKCIMSKTLDLGHAINSGSAGKCKDIKTCLINLFL
jgi:hypothetical protein